MPYSKTLGKGELSLGSWDLGLEFSGVTLLRFCVTSFFCVSPKPGLCTSIAKGGSTERVARGIWHWVVLDLHLDPAWAPRCCSDLHVSLNRWNGKASAPSAAHAQGQHGLD